jgi:1-deoxy-D-xylulose-5-phosphate synthase
MREIEIGKAKILREGQSKTNTIAILGFGSPVYDALQAGEELDATVVNMRFVKPLDTALIEKMAHSHEYIITVEDNSIQGGAGSAVNEVLAANTNVKIKNLGLPDIYQNHASREQLLEQAGIDAPSILKSIQEFTEQKTKQTS